MRKPNFFIVGAPKCGTTAMHEYLRQHPDIFLPDWKEPHFFGSDLRPDDFQQDLARYESLFADWADESRGGESSTWYLYSKRAAEEIKAYSPNADIIIMLRNPVEMLYSLYGQMTFNGDPLPPFAEAIETEDKRLAAYLASDDTRAVKGLKLHNCFHSSVACYTEQVRRYFEVFGVDHVHVILYDDFKADPANAYRRTLQFLSVAPDFQVDFRVFNANKTARSPIARTLMRATPMWIRRLADAAMGERLRRRVTTKIKGLNTRYQPRQPMDPAVGERLKVQFRDEVSHLSDLLGRDLSHWTR